MSIAVSPVAILRCVIVDGRGHDIFPIRWSVKCVRDDGRDLMGWLVAASRSSAPNLRWVMVAGRRSTGRSNDSPKVRWVSEEGSRLLTGWLKPNKRLISQGR